MARTFEEETLEKMREKINKVLNQNYLGSEEAVKESCEALDYIAGELDSFEDLYKEGGPHPNDLTMPFTQYHARQRHKATDVNNTLALLAIRELCENLLEKGITLMHFTPFNEVFEVLNRADGVNDDINYFD